MERNYTEAVRDGFFDLIEKDTVEIWENLDRSVAMIKSGKWKEHYSEVVAKYRFSSRFAIMRVLFEITTGLSRANTDDIVLKNGFEVLGIGKFPDISIKHAKSMTDEEIALYRKLLLRRVDESNPGCCDEAKILIGQALSLPADGLKSNLSRNELIRLGHMVNFSLEHMQFILLRVLGDNEAGFKYSASTDIIDIYGFLTRSTLAQVDELKVWYDQNAAKIKKVEYADKPVQFTQDIANSLEQIFSQWSPENRVAEFQGWLLKNAPYLDLKSKTARKVYINLAAYAYILTTKSLVDLSDTIKENLDEITGENLYEDIEKISQIPAYPVYAQQLFFNGSKPDAKKCESIAEELIYENAEHAGGFNIHDNNSELLYHVLHVKNGKVTSRGKLNKNSKNRIRDILMDKVAPEKSDLLYLLWFAANSQWIGTVSTAEEKVTFMDDFLAAAACILDTALLPEFYPPNILEETIMLALSLGNDNNTPAMIYESICSSFTDKGKAKKPVDAKKKTLEEKKVIAENFFSHRHEYPSDNACEIACAACFAIGKASVANYWKQYIVQYFFDHLAEFTTDIACKKACAKHFNKTVEDIEKYCKDHPKGLK